MSQRQCCGLEQFRKTSRQVILRLVLILLVLILLLVLWQTIWWCGCEEGRDLALRLPVSQGVGNSARDQIAVDPSYRLGVDILADCAAAKSDSSSTEAFLPTSTKPVVPEPAATREQGRTGLVESALAATDMSLDA